MGMIKRLFIFIAIILVLGLLSIYYPQLTGESVKEQVSFYEKEPAVITRVVDGDTIKVKIDGNNKEETIRLSGINNIKVENIWENKYTKTPDNIKSVIIFYLL